MGSAKGRRRFDPRNPVQDRPLEVLLHHCADRLGQAGVGGDRKVERADRAALDQVPQKAGSGIPALTVSMMAHRIIGLFRRAEDALDDWVVVKERQEDRDAFHNRRPQPGFDAQPVLIEPALDRFKLLARFSSILGSRLVAGSAAARSGSRMQTRWPSRNARASSVAGAFMRLVSSSRSKDGSSRSRDAQETSRFQ